MHGRSLLYIPLQALLDDFDYSSDEDEGNTSQTHPPPGNGSPSPMISSDG